MQNIINQLPGVVYEYVKQTDGKRYFSFISPGCESILGICAERILADPAVIETALHPEDSKSFFESAHHSHQCQTGFLWEGRIMVRGDYRWIEVRSNHEEKDGTIYRRGLILDITERKEKESQSELRYESLVQHLPLGVAVHVNGTIVFANKYAHSMIGVNPPDLIGANVIDFVHEDFRPAIAERMKSVVEGKEAPLMEQRFKRTDGQIVEAETIALPFNFKGIPAVQVISRDVTERKKAQDTIRKNETLFSQLFDNVPMGVVLLDDSGKVNQINRGFIEMFGYDLEELRGQNLNDFIVPEDLKHEGLDLNNLITSNKVVSVETIRQHRNGNQVNVILYGLPVLLDRTTLGIYGVYVDITDRKLVEEELKTRNGELDNFVYKVSHDLRAPLSSILGLVNLARLPGNTDNPMDYINIIGEKVEHLDHFIGDVLSHSKNLKMKVTVQRVDFQEIINNTFDDLDYLEGAIDVKRLISITGVDFYSDPWRISEIFRNLISNAIKYKKPDNQSEVDVKIIIDHMYADISFSDNGIGIEESSLDRIFEMFYRATEHSDGSGIGLYIVKNAVDKLGGQISVSSRLGEGTRFHLILPNKTNNGIAKSVLEHSGLRNN